MAEKVTLEILTKLAGVSGSSSSGDSGSKSKGGIFGAVSAIAGVGLGVAGVLSLLKDMFWSLKPLLSVISSIAKMLGMFLQPIAEVLMLLLVPILTLLRPIVQAFNVMLAPFINLIRQLGGLANQQAAEGDITGLIQTSSLMMEAIIGPFILILSNSIMDGLLTLLSGVLVNIVSIFYDINILIAYMMDNMFKTKFTEAAIKAKKDGIKSINDLFSGMMTSADDGLSIILTEVYNSIETQATYLGLKLPTLFSTTLIPAFSNLVDDLTNVIKSKRLSSSRSIDDPILRKLTDEYNANYNPPAENPALVNYIMNIANPI